MEGTGVEVEVVRTRMRRGLRMDGGAEEGGIFWGVHGMMMKEFKYTIRLLIDCHRWHLRDDFLVVWVSLQ